MNMNTEITTVNTTTLASACYTMEQLTAAGNNLTRGLVACGQQIMRLQGTMLRNVTAMGFIIAAARRQHPRGFCQLFPKKQGDTIKPGMFACSYVTAYKYEKTAAAIWQRACAAGRQQELEAQVNAYLVDAQTFDAPQSDIPVLHELIDTEWVSMHQVMVELGVINPGKHRALPSAAPAETPALPGMEDYCAQAWQNTSSALASFRELMLTDIPRLDMQQRHTLREELQGMLAELDRMEAAAPAMN